MAAPGILFREVIKKFKKKKLEYIELSTKKKIIHEVSQSSSKSFQILNCYMIIHYEYLLSMWVVMKL